jgi:hypothetical protein
MGKGSGINANIPQKQLRHANLRKVACAYGEAVASRKIHRAC